MIRKISFLLVLVSLFGATFMVSADAVDGCYATAPETVNEDVKFTVTVQCDNIPVSNRVFGFQIGGTRTGDFDASLLPSAYTQGTFATGFGATSGVLVGTNALGGQYAASRQGPTEWVSAEDFTLGSYDLTAKNNLITEDGSVEIKLTNFILSNDVGSPLSGWLRDDHDVNVLINDIDLAWLSGDVIVRSDVTAITAADVVSLVLGDQPITPTGVVGNAKTFTMNAAYRYFEGVKGAEPHSNDSLIIAASADMTGHLACSNNIDLLDTGSATAVTGKIGIGGTVTLKAGDANDDGLIDIDDATLIGSNYNLDAGLDIDINGDNIVNILDLVHVGRNYSSTSGSCGTGA